MKNKINKISIAFLFVTSAAAFVYLNTCGLTEVASAEVLMESTSDVINSSGSLPDVRIVSYILDVLTTVFTIR